MTTTTTIEEADYEAAYTRYLHAFIHQFGPPGPQPWQKTTLLMLATAMGVRDGNRSLKNPDREGETLPISAQGFRLRAQALLGLDRDREASQS